MAVYIVKALKENTYYLYWTDMIFFVIIKVFASNQDVIVE